MERDPQVFIVKANDGQAVRLSHFASLLNDVPFEVVMVGLPSEEIASPVLQIGRLVWWSPYRRDYSEAFIGDKPSEITSDTSKGSVTAVDTNEYVQIARQKAARSPDAEDANGEVLFAFFDQGGYRVRTLRDLRSLGPTQHRIRGSVLGGEFEIGFNSNCVPITQTRNRLNTSSEL